MLYAMPVESVPGPAIVERQSYYDVSGMTEPDIVRDLNAKGPAVGAGEFWAYTSTTVMLRYDTRKHGSTCALSSPSVRVTINTVIPRWVPRSQAAAVVTAKWQRLDNAIRAHEDEHAEIAREEARRLVAFMSTHSTGRTCKKLDGFLQAKAALLKRQSAAANEALDQRTGHGAAEGVAMSW